MQPFLDVASATARFQSAANIAQIIIAGAAVLALLGAAIQIRVSRAIARRQLAYEYLDRFSSTEIRKLIADFQEFWTKRDWAAFEALGRHERAELLVVPNLIEEIGSLYNRRSIDRDVIALALGVGVEHLWVDGETLIKGGRGDRGEWTYYEWQAMQVDTQTRRERAHRKIRRHRTWKNLTRGRGL